MTTSDDATPPEAESATRRSWYVSAAAADELAGAVEDLHYELRAPKHVVLAAIIRTGLAHLDEVRDRVRDPGARRPRIQPSESLLGLHPPTATPPKES
jgi:hypothetical protein